MVLLMSMAVHAGADAYEAEKSPRSLSPSCKNVNFDAKKIETWPDGVPGGSDFKGGTMKKVPTNGVRDPTWDTYKSRTQVCTYPNLPIQWSHQHPEYIISRD